MATQIPVIYSAPIIILVFIALHTIYRIIMARSALPRGRLNDTYFWLLIAVILFALWGIVHMYYDLYPFVESTGVFLHYAVSHLFLLGAMACIAVTISSIREKGGKSKK